MKTTILTKPSSLHGGRLRQQAVRICCVFILLLFGGFDAQAGGISDDALSKITFEQKLDSQVSLDLPFYDEAGRAVRLGNYFGHKPVILVLGYYECPMLCTLVLNGMVEGLEDLKWTIGNQFEVVNVSINPDEMPSLAAAKKASYIRRYGRTGASSGWHFLTGQQSSIAVLAQQVGFQFAYDPVSKQYAHPSGLVILTPNGKVSRYVLGVTFSGRDLYAGLKEASAGRVGSRVENLILVCFHYNPLKGKYAGPIMFILRLFAAATLGGLIVLVVWLVRADWSRPGGGDPAKIASSPGDVGRMDCG